MHVKHTSPNTNTSLAKAHLGWGSELEDGEKVGQVVPEQNPWLRYIWCRFFYCKNSKGQKIKPEIMIAIFFPLQIGQKHWQNKYLRTLPVTLMVSRPFLALVQVSCIASTGDMNTMSSPEVSWQQRVRQSLNFWSTQITVSNSTRQPATSKLP